MKKVVAEEIRFQSLIGRLKIDRSSSLHLGRFSFQSLIGRLKMHGICLDPYRTLSFQSLIGRLKMAVIELGYPDPTGVSIPYR